LDVWQQFIILLGGVPVTLSISVISFVIGIAVGLPIAFVKAYEKQLRYLVDIYEKLWRGIPEIVLLLLFYFGLGPILPIPFGNAFFVAVFVLGLRSGANQSLIYTGAIRGVGDEQMVAGTSVGLSKWSTIRRIMMPQVFTFSTPGLGSEYALLIKDSAYVYVLGGLADLMKQTTQLRYTAQDVILPYVLGAILYIVLTFPIAFALDRWGNKIKKQIGL
jgi:polar amino acid transport system permease protein